MAKIIEHELIAKHVKASDSEKNALLKRHDIEISHLPKILKTDPAIVHLNVKVGDIIKIERISKTAGTTYYYRAVVEG